MTNILDEPHKPPIARFLKLSAASGIGEAKVEDTSVVAIGRQAAVDENGAAAIVGVGARGTAPTLTTSGVASMTGGLGDQNVR